MPRFPWFEPRTAPINMEDLARVINRPLISGRIDEIGVRYLVWIEGTTERTDESGSLNCTFFSGGIPACFGFLSWESGSNYEASVWDVERGMTVGTLSSEAAGTSFVPAVVVPIPVIARVREKACANLSDQIKTFIHPTWPRCQSGTGSRKSLRGLDLEDLAGGPRRLNCVPLLERHLPGLLCAQVGEFVERRTSGVRNDEALHAALHGTANDLEQGLHHAIPEADVRTDDQLCLPETLGGQIVEVALIGVTLTSFSAAITSRKGNTLLSRSTPVTRALNRRAQKTPPAPPSRQPGP